MDSPMLPQKFASQPGGGGTNKLTTFLEPLPIPSKCGLVLASIMTTMKAHMWELLLLLCQSVKQVTVMVAVEEEDAIAVAAVVVEEVDVAVARDGSCEGLEEVVGATAGTVEAVMEIAAHVMATGGV